MMDEKDIEILCDLCSSFFNNTEDSSGIVEESIFNLTFDTFDTFDGNGSADAICGDFNHSLCFGNEGIGNTGFLLRHSLPQILLAFIAILINGAELHVIAKPKRKRLFPSEHLMRSLCIADLLFSCLVCLTIVIQLINDMHEFIANTRVLGEISKNLIDFSIFASVAHIVSISLDRLVAVMRPLQYRAKVSTYRMKKVICAIWLFTIILTLSIAIYRYHNLHSGMVNENSEENSNIAASLVLFISAGVISIIYIVLTRKIIIKSRFLRQIRSTQRRRTRNTMKKRIEKIVLVSAVSVTIAFIVCTVPYGIVQIVGTTDYNISTFCQCLLICNSLFNPLVYFWRGYWIRNRKNRRITVNTTITNLSRSRDSEENSENGIATITRLTTSLACDPLGTIKSTKKLISSKSGRYDLTDVTLFDTFDFDTISRFRKLDGSFYDRNRNAVLNDSFSTPDDRR